MPGRMVRNQDPKQFQTIRGERRWRGTEAVRLPAGACPVPYGFGSGFHVRLVCFVFAAALPICAEVTRRAWDCCSIGVPRAGVFRSWTRAGSLVFPGHPSDASARLSDPGRTDRTSPFAVLLVLPPASQHRRLQRVRISRLNAGLWHPLPTLHEPRCRCPCKARFRLAGCASAGRVSNPLDSFERFQSTSILLSSTCTTRWNLLPNAGSEGPALIFHAAVPHDFTLASFRASATQ